MSDINRMPPGNPPGGIGLPAGGLPQEDLQQKLKGLRSVFNPTDLSMMRQEGEIDPNMSVLELLTKLGIDPKGPITQFQKFTMDQMKNSNPLRKLQAFAGQAGGPPGGEPPPVAPGGAPGGAPLPPDFDRLMK